MCHKLRFIYIALLYDYGKPPEYSYEFYNLEQGLLSCHEKGILDLQIYHIDQQLMDFGRDQADKNLQNLIDSFQPDVIMDVGFDDNICPNMDILKKAKEKGINVGLWNCDATWRFNSFIIHRKDFYSFFITTHKRSIPWFQNNNMPVIMSNWACSPLYKPMDIEKTIDVSFVGQKHGVRGNIINTLFDHKIDISLFGKYWDGFPNNNGYVSFDKMVDVFNRSKINLNISLPSQGGISQNKGRHWELPACKSFQLTTPAEGLEEYFINGEEIVVAHDMNDLINKIKYYLSNDKEREEIAEAGYQRCMRDHTWEIRFKDILKELGYDAT